MASLLYRRVFTMCQYWRYPDSTRTNEQENIHGLVFQSNSSWLRAARSLLGLENPNPRLQLISSDDLSERELQSIGSLILNELDIEITLPVKETDEDLVVQKFGKVFPPTIELSRLAREIVDVNLSDPDETLLRWI